MRNYQKKPICTTALVIINVAVFLGLSLIGMTEDSEFMMEHGAMYVPYLMEGQRYYTIFTSIFLHFGFSHLMNNMIMLLVIGYNLEPEIGKLRFLIIYLGSGVIGNIVSAGCDISRGSYAVSAGASGAIFGIAGALLYVVVRNHGILGEISTRGLVLMAGLSLYYGFTAQGVDNACRQSSAMCLYDSMRQRQTKSGSGRFVSYKWLENSIQIFWRDSATVIRD